MITVHDWPLIAAFATQPAAPVLRVSAPVVALRSKIAIALLDAAIAYAFLPSGLILMSLTRFRTPVFTVHDWLAIAAFD